MVIDVVDEFIYLASKICNYKEDHEIKTRINLANILYFSLLLSELKCKEVHRVTKIKLKTMIRPVLYYGRESWTLNTYGENAINFFERKILRRILD